MHIWTEEEIGFAAALWKKNYSATGISNAFRADLGIDVSRNSVIGIVHRKRDMFPQRVRGGFHGAQTGKQRGAVKRKSPGKPIKARPPLAIVKATTPAPAPAPLPTPLAIECRHVTLMERGPRDCCWPTNDGGPFTYCGLPISRGSYCEHHAVRLIGLGTDSERRAHIVSTKEAA